ncbi:MAG: hypothetical protein ACRDLB_04405 [Actinomycetota bacterium]
MIEAFLTFVARVLGWLWASAATLYYLAGFFVVAGGLVMFVGTVAHHFWKLSREERRPATPSHVTVHIENLNVSVQITQAQLRELLQREPRALPPGDVWDEPDE